MASDIAAKIEQWRGQLLDTSKRNRVIHFKTGRTGGVALARPDAGRVRAILLAEEKTMGLAWRGDPNAVPPVRTAAIGPEGDDARWPSGRGEPGRLLRSPRPRGGRPHHRPGPTGRSPPV